MTRSALQRPAAACLVFLLVSTAFSENISQPEVFGWVEEGLLLPENISLKIKLDTGALTSTLDAKDIERFGKDNEEWVRFNIELKDGDTGEFTRVAFQRRVERNVKIRVADRTERRPVVQISLCIGNQVYTEKFSLDNREKMLYPVLIGRRTLMKLGAVDVSRTFTVEPKCLRTISKQ